MLEVPADYRIGIVPASDTGAVEMALWSLLGPRPVTMLAWESFGEGWIGDVQKELKLKDVTVLKAPYGDIPGPVQGRSELRRGVHLERHDLGRAGAERRLDQGRPRRARHLRRHLGGVRAAARLEEARCRDLLLAEGARRRGRARHDRAVAAGGRAARKPRAAWPIPKIFRLTKGGKINEDIFEGGTINTPSMLCVEDWLDTLTWAKSVGGLNALIARADANAKVIADWVARTPWIDFLTADPAIRSNTSVCLKVATRRC